jgi:MFS family permease
LWTANAVSNLGDGVTLVAGPLLAASLTRDPRLVAGLAVAQRLPWLLFSLVSGALVDRLDRRRLMVRVDAARCVAVGLLGVAVLADVATLPLLYVVFFALGTAETLFDNAAVSILPGVVPREQLARANGRLLGAQMVANELAGPPLGGLLFATAAALPFLLDAGSFAAAAVLVAAMSGRFRVERPEGTVPTTLRSEIAEGVRWLVRHRLLRILAVAIALMNLTLTATLSISVLFAQERLGLGSVGYGLLLSSMAVGGISASLVAERVIGWLGPATTLRVGLVIESSTHLVLAVARSPVLVGASFALFGFHAMTWSVISVSLRQELIPARLLGRVNSAYAVFGFGSSSLGAVAGGVLAARYGLTAPFWGSFVAMAVLTVACWPILSSRAVAQARAQAATEGGGR